MSNQVIIVMGVSGSGKSTVGSLLAQKVDLPFYDADDFHSQMNINKMKSGSPLNDDDRQSWLQNLADNLVAWGNKGGVVLSCSALKERYRQSLTSRLNHDVKWIYLDGTYELIKARLEARNNHFMNSILLRSQFKDLEIPTYGIKVDISLSQKEIVDYLCTQI